MLEQTDVAGVVARLTRLEKRAVHKGLVLIFIQPQRGAGHRGGPPGGRRRRWWRRDGPARAGRPRRELAVFLVFAAGRRLLVGKPGRAGSAARGRRGWRDGKSARRAGRARRAVQAARLGEGRARPIDADQKIADVDPVARRDGGGASDLAAVDVGTVRALEVG